MSFEFTSADEQFGPALVLTPVLDSETGVSLVRTSYLDGTTNRAQTHLGRVTDRDVRRAEIDYLYSVATIFNTISDDDIRVGFADTMGLPTRHVASGIALDEQQLGERLTVLGQRMQEAQSGADGTQ